jgi:tRNA(Ile2) C34 agmatinyltransferase TiaS
MDIVLIMIIVIITTVCIMLLIGIVLYFVDKHTYNNGVCKKCGGTMKCFDTDSQGGYGYSCDKCENHFWISWYKPNKD